MQVKLYTHEKSETTQVIFLNLICNGIQMVLTVIIGYLIAILMLNTM
jgi:hypothetical protein